MEDGGGDGNGRGEIRRNLDGVRKRNYTSSINGSLLIEEASGWSPRGWGLGVGERGMGEWGWEENLVCNRPCKLLAPTDDKPPGWLSEGQNGEKESALVDSLIKSKESLLTWISKWID